MMLVIARETGVVFHQQCGSTYVVLHSMEGFALSLYSRELTQTLYGFFEKHRGSPFGKGWSQKVNHELTKIINKIVFYRSCVEEGSTEWLPWRDFFIYEDDLAFQYRRGKVSLHIEAMPPDHTEFFNLEPDFERWSEAVAGWIPVRTKFGPGALLFKNYD